MSKVPPKSKWRKLAKSLYWISIIGLIFLNVYAAIGKYAMQRSLERTRLEIESRETLKPVLDQYYNESLLEFEKLEAQVHQMRKQLRDDDELLPILDHEFVITRIDGQTGSGEATICLSAPANGKHKLRIQTMLRNERLTDQQFDLASGRGYRIKFVLIDSQLKLLFPGEEPVTAELTNFEFSNRITSLRTSLAGSQTFVSSNQPRWWTLQSSSKTEEYGVLAQFAFMSDSYEPEEHVSIKITAESDGPPTAAADNTATILHLESMLESGREPEYRFEDGRYIFER